ncbi:MAG: ChbG/HpnK family deacetylase [Bryobacteraceae bacterium]
MLRFARVPEERLIVNADDFGFTRDVNAGIVRAHREGILTATTLMAYGNAFDDAVSLARENPALDIGCHLTLVGAPRYPKTVARLIEALALKRINPHEEFSGQIRKILDAGLTPTHLDTHKHTHLLPPVLDAVARISEEFRVPWVRRPFDLPFQAGSAPWKARLVNRAFHLVRRRFERVLNAHGCRYTDHFAGFQITGCFDSAELALLIRQLPDGTTEFMCHPGICGEELRAAPTRLKESRERELEALMSAEVRKTVRESRIILSNYRDLEVSG